MGKTRDLFKKIGDMKRLFHASTCTIKDRNSKDLTEAEDIRKRWQEYTEELNTKKGLNVLDNSGKPSWCNHSPRARYPGI